MSAPFDYTTSSLAAIALASSIVLAACGPDNSGSVSVSVAPTATTDVVKVESMMQTRLAAETTRLVARAETPDAQRTVQR